MNQEDSPRCPRCGSHNTYRDSLDTEKVICGEKCDPNQEHAK